MADESKSIFMGCGAFVGRIDGESQIWFWNMHPADVNFDPALLVSVDLAYNVSAARAGRIDWDEIVIDENVRQGGRTTIGPLFPGGEVCGAVYLEQTFWERLRAEIRPTIPPPIFQAQLYEFQAVLYWPGSNNRRAGYRYQGFFSKILGKDADGIRTKVEVYHGGESHGGGRPPVTISLDFSSVDVDASLSEGGLTEISPDGPQSGAIFLEESIRTKNGISIPKLPAGEGETEGLKIFLPMRAELRRRIRIADLEPSHDGSAQSSAIALR